MKESMELENHEEMGQGLRSSAVGLKAGKAQKPHPLKPASISAE